MNNTKKITGILVIATMMMFACKNSRSGEAVPARITEPTAETRAELARLVSTALHDATVVLADNALTDNSQLIIERRQFRDQNNNPVMGRNLNPGPIEHFRLLLKNGLCVLVQQSTGNRWTLEKTHCIAE
jgi:hypothetical protein